MSKGRPARRRPDPAPAARKPAAGGVILDLDRYVPALITFIANKLSRTATARYQRDFGVTVTEWRIMSLLAVEPEISAARICHVIGFDKGPVSRTLSSMEGRGLISIAPAPGDARSHAIALTAAGRGVHDRVIRVALQRERQLLSCLAPDEQETLIALLLRLHGNLDAVTD
jgi:DNA-binding MarR family transcriptional regulator